jgi:hypothetical protein
MILTTEPTEHVIITTLIVYNVSKRCAGLKRKMFGCQMRGDQGQLATTRNTFS